MSFITRTFGVSALRRDQIITRGPRFQIAFDGATRWLAKFINKLQPSVTFA